MVGSILSIIAYFITLSILSHWLVLDSDMYYMIEFTMNSTMTWLIIIIQPIIINIDIVNILPNIPQFFEL